MKKYVLTVGLVVAMAAGAQASLTDFGLTGNTSYDGWTDLTASGNPGYGSYPGMGTWPSAIGSNEAGSGDAEFMKLSGSGYPATSSLLAPSGGIFEVSDATVLSGLETIVLAIDWGAGSDASFLNGPVLSINGGTVVGAASHVFSLGSRSENVGGQDVTITTDIYQWDLGSAGAVTDFAISYDMGSHSTQYGLQLEQSDVYTEAIPEPATLMLLGGASGMLCLLRRLRIG